ETTEKADFEKARQELLENMGNWNNSFYGPIPYLLSYAAGGTSLQFFAITNKKQLVPISSQYDLTLPLGEFSEAYAAISKSKYAVFAKKGPELKHSKKCNGFTQTYYVQLAPVCRSKRLPHNERELCDAISAILNVLNLLHGKALISLDLVHRDIRWSNVLMNNGNWLLSDYEH
ncbi:6376_t:CDS:2, partial [Dentiscutata erythropus]